MDGSRPLDMGIGDGDAPSGIHGEPAPPEGDDAAREVSPEEAVRQFRRPVIITRAPDGSHRLRLADDRDGLTSPAALAGVEGGFVGLLPPLYPEWLGDRSFTDAHAVRFPYVVGEMARGIATARMVIAAARAGVMGFFGSAGLPLADIRAGVAEITAALGPDAPGWGANLIHAPNDPGQERAVVDLALETGVRRLSASAFMRLSPEIVRYAARGLTRGPDGAPVRSTWVFAKVSRAEVAAPFLAPAPAEMLRALVAAGDVTPEQADLAREVSVAEDITAEADSGGHTDNRALTVLLPALFDLRARLAAEHRLARPARIGAAGGLGAPAGVAAAFQAGAAYVVTGSVNQSAVESGLSETGRAMLAEAGLADMAMAPAADMFERGVKVQVLQRGSLFAARAKRLYELYRARAGLHELTVKERAWLEDQLLREPVEAAWEATRSYLAERRPDEIAKADADPKHKMALVFRRYLFSGSEWARQGEGDRRADFQIWCGPAMGAFNSWVKGSFLEAPERRHARQIALNLLEGAAALTRAHQLRAAGVPTPPSCFAFSPRPLD
ncbi:MAG: PfaD family polyunsaturated fatty acid/polyketide biosynthesis protein [Caulobacterales bacterium]|nr:PfaD family polyunsaturated fatty acid/polyketide biosynthesis protein [Caulobacterales bacterium]